MVYRLAADGLVSAGTALDDFAAMMPSTSATLDVLYGLLVDEHVGGFASRHQVREEVDKWLAEGVPIDPEEWGRSPQAIADQRSLMDELGGEAPARAEAGSHRPREDGG